MQKVRKLAEKLCTELELPEETVLRKSKISAVGGRRLLIENHRGLLSYSDNALEVLTDDGKISVFGSGFIIRAMKEGEMLIYGDIQSMEWDR